MLAALSVGDLIIAKMIEIRYMLILLRTSMSWYTLEEGKLEHNGRLF